MKIGQFDAPTSEHELNFKQETEGGETPLAEAMEPSNAESQEATDAKEVYVYNGFKFVIENGCGEIDKEKLHQITGIIEDINPYLDTPLTGVTIWPASQKTANGQVIDSEVFLSERGLSLPSMKSLVWHEVNHVYINQLRGPVREYIKEGRWKEYGEEFEPLFQKALELSYTPEADRVNRNVWPRDYKENSLMMIFNSHAYANEDIDLGHPYLHMGELYSYATEIMRYHPQALLQNIESLPTDEERALARAIVDKVARSYIRDGSHPENLRVFEQFLIKE